MNVADLFEARFGGAPASLVRAPGRVELLGNHTDYNQGLIMALAVDKYITMAATPRGDHRVVLVSSAFPEPAEFAIDDLRKDPAASWANYVKGVLLQLQERGVPLGGLNVALHSTIPLGAGLSSSAALLVATALTARRLFPYTLDAEGRGAPLHHDGHSPLPPLTAIEQMTLAKLCQAAENRFVGVNCGLLDHISSLFGRAHRVILIDCLHLNVDWSPLAGDVDVVVCHSGVTHALVGGEYNDRRAHCESAARTLGVPSLRFATLDALEAARDRLTPRDYQCARHVVGENDRVTRGAALLRDHQLEAFGQLLFESHTSSRDLFLNSCVELDALVEMARAHPGCLGSRLTGGGFGGATLSVVRRDQTASFREHMAAGYRARYNHRFESWVCEVVDGAN